MNTRCLWSTSILLIIYRVLQINCLQFSDEEIDNLADTSEREVNQLFEIESFKEFNNTNATIRPNHHGLNTAVFSDGLVLPDSPEAIRGKFSQAQPTAITQAKLALVAEKIASQLMFSFNIPTKDISSALASQNIKGTKLDKGCETKQVDSFNPAEINGQVPNCVRDIYRTFDGTCNNPVQKQWGKSFTKFLRLIPTASYADGVSAPRNESIQGGLLPSPRSVSRTVILNKPNKKDKDDHFAWSHFFALFGQFLDHDITNTPQFTASADGRPPQCCNVANPHQECFTIDTSDDPIFMAVKKSCMEFVRSLPAKNNFCNLAPREQMNQVTTFIDGSQIYGSTEEEANELKDSPTGKLKVTKLGKEDLLKNNGVSPTNCDQNPKDTCDFQAGDGRVNMVPSLVSMHTLWLRQHNRLVDELRKHGWSDPEDLYHQARRIVGAQLQHITYNEFLPIVFLKNPDKFEELNINNSVHYDIFNNPGILNEFATAAFRFGHSMIKGEFTLADLDLKIVKPNPNNISEHYFTPYDLYKSDKVNEYLRGHTIDHSQETNNIMTNQLTNFLFKKPGTTKPTLDLASLNIQRGRDHGLPSYMAYREKCDLSRPTTFEELNIIMLPDCVSLLQKVYKDVEDIDLWVGGLCENPESIGAVGPVFACIIGKQFSKLRKNDRFFYDHQMPPASGLLSPFTQEQVAEIKKTTLSKVICWNSNFKKIREKAMLLNNDDFQPCSVLKKSDMNMEVFKEVPTNKPTENLPGKLQQLLDAFQISDQASTDVPNYDEFAQKTE